MPTEPAPLTFAIFELTLMFGGAGLLLTLLFNPRHRQRWLGTNLLPYWPLPVVEFLLFATVVLCTAGATQGLVITFFKEAIDASPDKAGLQVFAYGVGFHGGILAACALFPGLRRRLAPGTGIEPPPLRQGTALPWGQVLGYAAGGFAIALPVVGLVSFGWTALLRVLAVPDDPQDLIAIFAGTKSSLVVAGMLAVACVFAPLAEELTFRAGIYRFIRQRLGRRPALLASALLFGMLHGNWAVLLPLFVLGIILALAYEATGSIRVPILIHALFNLNTLVLVLSGLSNSTP